VELTQLDGQDEAKLYTNRHGAKAGSVVYARSKTVSVAVRVAPRLLDIGPLNSDVAWPMSWGAVVW
jgi:hypothetical protein